MAEIPLPLDLHVTITKGGLMGGRYYGPRLWKRGVGWLWGTTGWYVTINRDYYRRRHKRTRAQIARRR